MIIISCMGKNQSGRKELCIRINPEDEETAEIFEKFVQNEEKISGTKRLKSKLLWKIIKEYLDKSPFYDKEKVDEFWTNGIQFKEVIKSKEFGIKFKTPGGVKWKEGLEENRSEEMGRKVTKEYKFINMSNAEQHPSSTELTEKIEKQSEEFFSSRGLKVNILKYIYQEWFALQDEIIKVFDETIELFIQFLWDQHIFLEDPNYSKILSTEQIQLIKIKNPSMINREALITQLKEPVQRQILQLVKRHAYYLISKSEIFSDINTFSINTDKFKDFLPKICKILHYTPDVHLFHQKIDDFGHFNSPLLLLEAMKLSFTEADFNNLEVKQATKELFLLCLSGRTKVGLKDGDVFVVNIKSLPLLDQFLYFERFFDYLWDTHRIDSFLRPLYAHVLKGNMNDFAHLLISDISGSFYSTIRLLSDFGSLFQLAIDVEKHAKELPFTEILSSALTNFFVVCDNIRMKNEQFNEILQKTTAFPQLKNGLVFQKAWESVQNQNIISEILNKSSEEKSNMYVAYGSAAIFNGQLGDSVYLFEKALEYNTYNQEALKLLIHCLGKQNKFSDAERKLQQYFESHEKNVVFWTLQGWLLLSQNRVKEAIFPLEKALELEPNNTNALFFIADAYHDDEKYKESIKYYGKLIQLEPDNAEAIFNIALSYFFIEAYYECIENFNKYIDLEPEDPRSHYNIAVAYAKLGKTQKSLEYLSKAITMNHIYLDKAMKNPEFDKIRKDPSFIELVTKNSA